MKLKSTLALLALSFTLCGCAKEQHTSLTIFSEENNINYYEVITEPDNRKELFKNAFEEEKLHDINYIENGKTITLDFGTNPPDAIALNDVLVNSKGMQLYSDKQTLDIPLDKDKNKYTFILSEHKWALLSSLSPYNRIDYRGFLITATWGDKKHEFTFVIKTKGSLPSKDNL